MPRPATDERPISCRSRRSSRFENAGPRLYRMGRELAASVIRWLCVEGPRKITKSGPAPTELTPERRSSRSNATADGWCYLRLAFLTSSRARSRGGAASGQRVANGHVSGCCRLELCCMRRFRRRAAVRARTGSSRLPRSSPGCRAPARTMPPMAKNRRKSKPCRIRDARARPRFTASAAPRSMRTKATPAMRSHVGNHVAHGVRVARPRSSVSVTVRLPSNSAVPICVSAALHLRAPARRGTSRTESRSCSMASRSTARAAALLARINHGRLTCSCRNCGCGPPARRVSPGELAASALKLGVHVVRSVRRGLVRAPAALHARTAGGAEGPQRRRDPTRQLLCRADLLRGHQPPRGGPAPALRPATPAGAFARNQPNLFSAPSAEVQMPSRG